MRGIITIFQGIGVVVVERVIDTSTWESKVPHNMRLIKGSHKPSTCCIHMNRNIPISFFIQLKIYALTGRVKEKEVFLYQEIKRASLRVGIVLFRFLWDVFIIDR